MAITTNYTPKQKAEVRSLALKIVNTENTLQEDYGIKVVDRTYRWDMISREIESIIITIEQDGREEFLKFDL